MARVVVTSVADADTDAILDYLTVNAGGHTAAKYGWLFDRLVGLLADHPEIGVPRPRLGRGVRIGIVPPYIVIDRYTESDDTVTILRIAHGRRNIMRALAKGRR